MSRVAGVILIGVLIVTILVDPYTLRLNASDVIAQAPWWQTAIGLLSMGLLASVAVSLWRGRNARASKLLGIETLVTIGISIIYVQRDGISRFELGFGGEEYLTWFLIAVALRVYLLLTLPLGAAADGRGRNAGCSHLAARASGREKLTGKAPVGFLVFI